MELVSPVGLCVCAAVPVLYILWRYHPRYGANPGLPILPLLGCLPFVLLNKHRFYLWTCELFDRSPTLTRRIVVGRTTVLSTADPVVVHHLLKSHFPIYPKGPSFYCFFADLLGNGIFNCDGPLWRFQRKVASHEFTSNSLKEFVIEIADAEICRRLVPALDWAIHFSGGLVDLQALLMHYSFDTICQLTFGADTACLEVSKIWKSHGRCKDSAIGFASDVTPHVTHDRDAHGCGTSQGSCINNTGYVSHGHRDAHANHEGCSTSMQQDSKLHSSNANRDVNVHTSYMTVPDNLIEGFVEGFQEALRVVAERFLVPSIIWQTKRYLRIGSERRLWKSLEAVNEFTSFVIEQSKIELSIGKERKDLLARFMQLSKTQVESLLEGEDESAWKINCDNENGHILSDSLLKNILLSFILAGRETVASGVTFLMWLLCKHPRVEKAILEEMKGILQARKSSNQAASDTDVRTFSYDELRKMNYLHAALSESMRLYPPVPSDTKCAAEDDTLPDGTPVFKGYLMSFNVFAMGRAQRVWGKDCLEFRPERWLGEDGQFVPASPYKYPVFQAGPRICLGKDFAFIQMKLLVASLVRDFEFAVQPGFEPNLPFGVSLYMLNGLPVTLKRRLESLS